MTTFFSWNGAALLPAAVVFGALLTLAAISDVRSRRIPNGLVVIIATTGLLASVMTLGRSSGLAHGVGGIAVGLVIWFPFFALRWIGAGDVKLFASAAAWLGPARTLEAALIAALLGGVLAIAWMVRAHGAREATTRVAVGIAAPTLLHPAPLDVTSRRAIPYGVSLAIGAFAAAWIPPLLHGGVSAIH